MSEGQSHEQKRKAPSLGEVTGVVTLSLALASAWLYVAGWTYASHYFDEFGIPLLMVEIPKEHYFVYGSLVVRQFPLWELVIAIILVAAAVLARRLRVDAGRLTIPLGVVGVLAAFWLARGAGAAAAYQRFIHERESDYSTYPRVQVWPKDSSRAPEGSPQTSADLTNGCYRLILHNQNRLFLLRPHKDVPTADLPLLVLPWEQVDAIRVLPEYTSCP
jgi:hypothetical protein